MESNKDKVKGERIRGRELRISERDIIGSLPFATRLRVWLVGGAFGMRDPESKLPKMVIVYIPPLWKRVYYKQLYKLFHKSNPKMDGVTQNDKG